MPLREVSTIVLLWLASACASVSGPPATPSGATIGAEPVGQGAAFAGLWLADADAGGLVVVRVVAGPAAAAGVRQGDRIARIDGTEVDAARAGAILSTSRPGTRLALEIVRKGETVPIVLTVSTREPWTGPAAYPSAVSAQASGVDGTVLHAPDAIAQALALAPDAVPVNRRLAEMFAALARDDSGYHKLPLIRAAFLEPGRIPAWRDRVIERAHAADGAAPLIEILCETLAITCPALAEKVKTTTSLSDFVAPIGRANERVRQVFASAGIVREQASADLKYLLETTASDRTLVLQPDAIRGLRAMKLSMRVDLSGLLAVAADLLLNAERLPAPLGSGRKPPAALAALVEGEILDFVELDGGYAVLGGAGANRYDMDRLYAVIDVGGNDAYTWGGGVARETQTLVDLGGNDRYLAAAAGPGAGWLGVGLLIDRGGDDLYESRLAGCGAGALGFGFLLDEGGTDTYRCAAWSIGAAVYGAGLLFDRGTESDAYLASVFSEGVGGPRGCGMLIDEGGGDLYRANGPVPSAYGLPASFMGFSQGVGVGIRPHDYGGAGVLLDLAGDDRYEGGEFSQGGGYFWGVGVLHDASGNDLYYGNRYAQGFAAHQAFGLLSDAAGDDHYWSMTAAGQGAAWDQSIALLLEGGGNDVYRGAWLSQGAAAEQARAALHDLSGDDVYWSSRGVSQGAAGGNSYHLRAEDPVYSLGVLLDDGGTDRYSTGLPNTGLRLRLLAEDAKTGRGIAGVAVDRDGASP